MEYSGWSVPSVVSVIAIARRNNGSASLYLPWKKAGRLVPLVQSGPINMDDISRGRIDHYLLLQQYRDVAKMNGV